MSLQLFVAKDALLLPLVKSESDYYTSKQKEEDRKKGCTEEQIQAVEKILGRKPGEWYDILGVSDTCTVEEARQAYKKVSLAVHPDRNPSTQATKAFQIFKDAAEALEDGDDYPYSDFEFESELKRTKKGKKPQSHPKPTAYQLQIYKTATPFMEKLREDPTDKEAQNELVKLNELIRDKNKKDGKPESDVLQGIIDFKTYITHVKLAIDYKKAIESKPITKAQKKNQALAKQKLPDLGPAIDMINVGKGYPRSWNIEGTSFDRPTSPTEPPSSTGPTSPRDSNWEFPLREPNKTRDGHDILGARQYGFRGYRFVVDNGKDWRLENCLEYQSGKELGFDIADAYFEGKEKKEWDMRCNVSRKEDAKNYRYIQGIASEPIKSQTTGSKPRYPESHIRAIFEKPTGEGYEPILSRSKLGDVIGKAAADREIATFYRVRSLTPPWEIGPIAIRDRKPMAIDAFTARAETLASAQAQAPEKTLLLTNTVEGMQVQMDMMAKLLQALAMKVGVEVPA